MAAQTQGLTERIKHENTTAYIPQQGDTFRIRHFYRWTITRSETPPMAYTQTVGGVMIKKVCDTIK